MAATVYSDYAPDRIGWFFGLTGWQLGTLAATAMPVFWAMQRSAWAAAGGLLMAWLCVAGLTIATVRGRSAIGWTVAATGFALGHLSGWARFRSRAASGAMYIDTETDLPGVLAGIAVHDGPPHGASLARVALIQNHAARTWAVTAAVVHPGIGMSEPAKRARQGAGLSELLDLAARTELIDEILFTIRSVPEDGAERDHWVSAHRQPTGPRITRDINNDLATALGRSSVRTEAFVTIVVPEARISRDARESGGGIPGRTRVLQGLMAEVEAHMRGGMAMAQVSWLTSPELAAACRTGFAPGDRAGVVDALARRVRDPDVNADVPWAMAGPSGADTAVRHYTHDAWNSVSCTLRLPERGAVMGALAPMLAPTEPGERRSLLVAYPIVRQQTANRQSASSEWAADVGTHLRHKAGVKQRAKQRDEASKAAGMDVKLARGSSMSRPYAVCTVTVPASLRIAEYGRRLDATARQAGFAPLRLDLAQDSAFAASTIPVGVSLTRRGDA